MGSRRFQNQRTYQQVCNGADYTGEEMLFMQAVERYKQARRRRFPSFTEILAILKSLGYRKTEAAVELPEYPLRLEKEVVNGSNQ